MPRTFDTVVVPSKIFALLAIDVVSRRSCSGRCLRGRSPCASERRLAERRLRDADGLIVLGFVTGLPLIGVGGTGDDIGSPRAKSCMMRGNMSAQDGPKSRGGKGEPIEWLGQWAKIFSSNDQKVHRLGSLSLTDRFTAIKRNRTDRFPNSVQSAAEPVSNGKFSEVACFG